ncbi:hypothetical protein BCEN4_940007 [Burkholderia cenocepacia]|nr:hypothetical protein BCEN4_940007 [Burkholderia cenocepacia]
MSGREDSIGGRRRPPTRAPPRVTSNPVGATLHSRTHRRAHDLARQEDLVSGEALRLGMGIAGRVAGLGRAAAVRDRRHRERMARAAASVAGGVRGMPRGAGRAADCGVLAQGREAPVAMGQRRLS